MSEILREDPAPGVALLRINRPEARNALNTATREALARHFREINTDTEIRAVILTGDAKAFAAGADLREFAELSSVDQMQRNTHLLWQTVKECPKPIVAAVNGYALGGGCELALHADIIVAGQTARFGQPEVLVGVMPGAGGTQRLTRAIGKYRAMKMVLLGEMVSAPEALAMGMVSEVVPEVEVEARALEMARKIASLPPLAVQQIKEVLIAGMDASLETGLLLERKAFHLLFSSDDQKEGVNAFLEKRNPEFKGR